MTQTNHPDPEEGAMSEQDTTETPTTEPPTTEGGATQGEAPPQTSQTPQSDAEDRHETPADVPLADQLRALKDEQAAYDAKLVEKAIADLEKLIGEVEAAKAGYTKADYDKLVAAQAALEAERKTLVKALEAALGDDIDAVKEVEASALGAIDQAAREVSVTSVALATKTVEAQATATAMAQAQAALDRWRKPKDSIEKRHKAAAALIEDIKKLRNGPHRGEAYWKLALGDRDRQGAQGFLHLLLKDPPDIAKPDNLDGKIVAAWDAFKAARAVDAAAQAELQGAQAAHKAAKADYDTKTKTIIDALAAREAPPAA